MPLAKLNTTAVTASQPPHRINAARVGSVRGARLVMTNPAARQITAAGSNHAMSRPIVLPNSLPQPTSKFMLPSPPGSSPVKRPKPLYPNANSTMLSCCEPPM